ncbi:MAG: bifunctional riboflavin kinase/FAD synthetase [Chloroflexaceae bacterium]|nr:bifunctional riboflavin kinase/FAD synthetase [Chloroflexaceae bacterium]
MHIAYALEQRITDQPSVLTIGKFDGFHRGHQLLVRTAIEHARREGYCSAVLTFDPHPATVIHPERKQRLITSLEERIELIAAFEPDWLMVAPFTRETMMTTAEAYMQRLCAIMPLRELWVGANFVMGHNREGDIPTLMEIGHRFGFVVGSIAPMQIEGAPVSSSRVRQLLDQGMVEAVQKLLDRPFGVRGRVVEGNQRGRTIGFPTANLEVDPAHMVPANGVYACCACVERQTVPAIVNVGVRPTFGEMRHTVEAHLLDWQGNLYGQVVRLEFLHRLRGEQKFAGMTELRAQIERDAAQAREMLR